MPATFPRIDPALFGKLTSGDEGALEQLFRQRYAALVKDQTPALDGDAAAAGRGVTHAFVQLYQQRASFATPDALEEALRAAVGDAAGRIHSRHAVAQHLRGPAGEHGRAGAPKAAPSVDDAWASVRAALHAGSSHTKEVAHQMADHTRHEMAEHLAGLARPRPRGPMIAAAAVLLAGVGGFAWWSGRGDDAVRLAAALDAPDARMVVTGNGEFTTVPLDDGASIRLGPDSRLRIPRSYGGSLRGVALEGTAAIAVPDGRTFMLRTGEVMVASAGGAFAVRAFPEETDIVVRVDSGDATITVADSAHAYSGGSAVVVTQGQPMRVPDAAEAEMALGWTSGTIVAADRPLREVLDAARRWFGVLLFVADTSLLDRRVTLRAAVGSSEEAVRSIERSGQLRRASQGPNMVLVDALAR